jgi:hypothetical protein
VVPAGGSPRVSAAQLHVRRGLRNVMLHRSRVPDRRHGQHVGDETPGPPELASDAKGSGNQSGATEATVPRESPTAARGPNSSQRRSTTRESKDTTRRPCPRPAATAWDWQPVEGVGARNSAHPARPDETRSAGRPVGARRRMRSGTVVECGTSAGSGSVKDEMRIVRLLRREPDFQRAAPVPRTPQAWSEPGAGDPGANLEHAINPRPSSTDPKRLG